MRIESLLDDITKRMDGMEILFKDFKRDWKDECNRLKKVIREIHKQNVKLRENK